MYIRIRTNLDLRGEQWPNDLPAVPRIGDEIESATVHNRGFQLRLQVVAVRWMKCQQTNQWFPEVELHMTKTQQMLRSMKPGAAQGSIQAFYEWYGPAIGSSVHAFI